MPGLATILVGEYPASRGYVKAKRRTANELGFYSAEEDLPVDISEKSLLTLIDKYNNDLRIDGILVQLPLPKHCTESKVLNAVDPGKDVNAFHPVNIGKVSGWISWGLPL